MVTSIVLAGGGTAGHVNPLLAVDDLGRLHRRTLEQVEALLRGDDAEPSRTGDPRDADRDDCECDHDPNDRPAKCAPEIHDVAGWKPGTFLSKKRPVRLQSRALGVSACSPQADR